MLQVVIDTTKGQIILELFKDKTPRTVNNFVTLANKGFYNGVVFHRVIPNFMIQTGDPKGTGSGGPGYEFECELRPDLKHETGTLSMAHKGACQHDKATGRKQGGQCTNGSQFFITHKPTSHLDGIHTVFGKVIQGQNIVNAIQQGDKMTKVTIREA